MNVYLGSEFIKLDKRYYPNNTGADVREPIATMLEKVNASGGNVQGITDGETVYIAQSNDVNDQFSRVFMTPDEVFTCFKEGTYILNRMPEKESERKCAATSNAIYQQLSVMSAILQKIIGNKSSGGNGNGE